MKTRGIRNNNPFNIKKSNNKWLGKIKGDDKVFETFDTLEHGYRAGLRILVTYYTKYKLHTYRQILNKFAPSSENNLDNYLYFIWQNAHILPDQHLMLGTLLYVIAPLITVYECGLPIDYKFSDAIVEKLLKDLKL